MFLLSTRVKTLGAVIAAGAAGFGITAAVITAASAQAANPVVPANTVTAAPSSASPKAVPELPIGPVTTVTNGKDISLPVDAYKASPSDQNLVLRAEYQEMKSCVARYGLAFDAPAAAWTVPAINHDYDRLFGLIDITDARKYGYHTGEELLPDGESKQSSTGMADPAESAPNYLAVAMGDPSVPEVNGLAVPSGGCIGEARSKLNDDLSAETLYEDAVNYGLAQSDADSRVIAAFGKWSKCMTDAGFSYATPVDAINDPEWSTTTPSAVEMEVAIADVECKTTTNLTGLRVAVAAAWQSQYIKAHAAQFAAMTANVGQQDAQAKAILGE
ncbi:hypothetical protein [Gryllotalpicola sp.]|uniref:hypothetical protein n=1 Tax=Gryllotalpicola sp. TaxID=1932787 RepID=UPI00262186AC|nr:hypothetical protein [Gryllotalpicola sp.]